MKKILTLALTLLFYANAFCQWEVINEMPLPVKGAKAIVQDTTIFIIGGFSDSVLTGTKKIQAYYPESNHWEILTDSIIIPRWGLSAESYGDSAFIFGGATTTNDSSYSMETWGYHNNSNIKLYNYNFNRSFAATNLTEEYLYIFGGYPDFELYDSLSYLVRFDMISGDIDDAFSINDSFAVDLPSHQMSAVVNNKIYVFGGILNSILRNISYLDLNNYSWNELEVTLSKPRAAGVALAHPNGSEIILIGGKNEESEALRLVETFNIDDFSTSEKRELTFARSEHTAVIYKENMIFVFGGKNVANEIVNQVERISFEELNNVTTTIENQNLYIFKDFDLQGNFPNPFNPKTDIIIRIYDSQYLEINIYDIQGRKIKSLYNSSITRGKHNITWDGTDDFNRSVTSGIYFYTVSSGKVTKTNRMLLIK